MDRRLVACRCGQLSPAIAAVSIGIAITLSPSFSMLRNALSDLGAHGAPTASVFNGGLILTALVALPFCWVLFVEGGRPVERIGAVLLAASLVSLGGVGMFPTGTALHLPAAVGFYLLATYGILAIGTGAVRTGRTGVGLVGLWSGVLVLSVWLVWGLAVVLGFPSGLALPESVGAALIGGWFAWTANRETDREAVGRR